LINFICFVHPLLRESEIFPDLPEGISYLLNKYKWLIFSNILLKIERKKQ